MPAYIAAIDIGITPYLDSPFNRASFPLKTLDYLSAGRPAVSTALPAARWLYDDLLGVGQGTAPDRILALANDREAFINALRRIVGDPGEPTPWPLVPRVWSRLMPTAVASSPHGTRGRAAPTPWPLPSDSRAHDTLCQSRRLRDRDRDVQQRTRHRQSPGLRGRGGSRAHAEDHCRRQRVLRRDHRACARIRGCYLRGGRGRPRVCGRDKRRPEAGW